MIDRTAFETKLRQDGYDEVLTRDWHPNQVVPEHTHPFDAHALVLEGEVTLTLQGRSLTCRAGDTFKVPAGTPHAETYGPAGARFLAGRRKPAAVA